MAKIKLNGDTSGYIEISAPAVSGNNTLELGPGTKILTNLDNTFTGVSTFSNGLNVTGGNVLVGTTDATIYNNGDSDSEGIVLRDGEVIDIARKGDLQLTLNRQTNDGPHIGFFRSGSPKTYISTRNDAFCIDTGGLNERLRITSDGKLLIGSDTGSVHGDRLLQVGKTDRSQTYVSIVSSTSGESGLLFADTTTNDTGGYRGQIRYHHSDDSMNFRTGATERLRIKSDGDVYIGNIAHSNDGGANSSYRTLTLTDTTNGAQLHLRGQSPKLFLDVTSGGNGEIYYDSGDLRILSGEPGTTSSEKLRITSDGNLSLGTTVSNERVNIHTASSLKAQVQFTNTTTGTGGSDGLVIGITGGEDSIFWNQENTNILFATNNTERVRITSAGKLGIGVQSPFSRIQSGGHTFSGGHGMHTNDRVGMSNHGQLTGLMLASTYNDSAHPEYGVVFVQGPNTSSYNVWSVSPDGPAKGNSLNLHYGAQSTNIHAPSNRKFEFTGEGYLLQPYQPKFRVGRNSSYSPGAGSDIIFNVDSGGGKHNVGGHYNTSNGRFTAPVAGVYTFTVHVIWEGLSNGQNMADCFHPKINGVVQGYSGRRGEYIANETGNSGYYTDFMTYQFTLAAGDYVTINNQFNRTIHGNSNYTTFSGHLVG